MQILVLHGWDDPIAPPQAALALAAELTAAKADWQLHAFMAEGVDLPAMGLQYNARSARRAWLAMTQFLADAFAA